MSSKARPPRTWRSLFWDYDFASLRFDTDRDLIIGRVLTQGGWSATEGLRALIGDDAIREWLQEHRARGLSPARIRFWELIVRIPARQASAWVRVARDGSWGRRLRA